MKLFFLILTLIFITTTINALSCINPDESIDIKDDFNIAAVQSELDELELVDEYECLVQISFYYYDQNIRIKFGTVSKEKDLYTNRNVFVETGIRLAEGTTTLYQGNIINIVEFVCDNANACDRRFVVEQLKWLFNVNYNKFESAIQSLLIIESEQIGKKINKKKDLSTKAFLIFVKMEFSVICHHFS